MTSDLSKPGLVFRLTKAPDLRIAPHQKTVLTSSVDSSHQVSQRLSYDDLPLVLSVDDLMEVLAIGRNTAYEIIRSGQIRSVRIGKQIRIPRDALEEFLAK